ncbi:DUF1554 domain-containing protein [Leptospira sp. FAT2]|uniref:DUF1554 domain-containing protein n=1 Tax=Leptospira sanjuanensis TaxID=2879643 RepID=UPI001EE89AF5|nr:DUF1554 domain-containing protein [Leptospira sanjuanensis]MCG6166491.1 DUF1554 domain-containing protein [Leptospira sanjuanensis]MCG6191882.1 DUF1554 domain-containing protein [Leptospira sanjuanensis]
MRKQTLFLIPILILFQCAQADKVQFDASKGLGGVIQIVATEVVNTPVNGNQQSGGSSGSNGISYGGHISGLVSGSITLSNGSSNVILTPTSPGITGGAGSYQFSSSLSSGSSYDVSISSFPANLSCNIYNYSGTASATVTDIDVYCYSVVITSTLTIVEGTSNPSNNFSLSLSHPPGPVAGSSVSVTYPSFPSNLSVTSALPTTLSTTTVNRTVNATNETGTPDFANESETITARVAQSIGSATNVSVTSDITITDNDKRMYLAPIASGTGNTGGKAGADTICNSNKPGYITGSVAAMIGTSTRKPLPTPSSDWPLKPLYTYYRDNTTTIIANSNSGAILPFSWSNKVSGNAGVTAAFACPAMGSPACGYITGMDNTWTVLLGQNCGNWTSNSSSASGMTGWAGSTDSNALSYFASACDTIGSSANIICVEL